MKSRLVLIILLHFSYCIQAQNKLEVEGKTKISDMVEVSSGDSIVVWLSDSTLARRNISTINNSGWNMNMDTVFTLKYVGIGTASPSVFGPDQVLEMMSSEENFGSVMQLSNKNRTQYLRLFGGRTEDPDPLFFWSQNGDLRFATDEGFFTEKFRIGSDGLITAQNKISNVSDPTEAQDVVTKSYFDQILLKFGISLGSTGIQGLLDSGFGPLEILAAGTTKANLYGKTYQGGLIFYLDDLDTIIGIKGLVAAPSDIGTYFPWGCQGNDLENVPNVPFNVNGPNGVGAAIGDGKMNSDNAALICFGGAAEPCFNLTIGIYDDWFLPSILELNLAYSNLKLLGYGNFLSEIYWSSTEINFGNAHAKGFGSGTFYERLKTSTHRVRPIRAF